MIRPFHDLTKCRFVAFVPSEDYAIHINALKVKKWIIESQCQWDSEETVFAIAATNHVQVAFSDDQTHQQVFMAITD